MNRFRHDRPSGNPNSTNWGYPQSATNGHHAANGNTVHEKPHSSAAQGNPSVLPSHNGQSKMQGIQSAGESGRRGFNPLKFLKLIFRSVSTLSMLTNFLWPFVPAAIALHFTKGDHHVWTFATSYIGMVPAAALLGFAGQEFSRKLPTVAGTLIESMFGSVVEIVLFMVLIAKHNPSALPGEGNLEYVIQAAILGSILANLLLCLGCVFITGGLRQKEQKFHPTISETGSGVLLVAGFALLIPSAFYSALSGSTSAQSGGGKVYTMERLNGDILGISHGVSIILMVAFVVYIIYHSWSHDNFLQQVLKADEQADRDGHKDLAKEKLTMTECMVAILISLVFVSLLAVFLVEEIEYLVHDRHVPDNFLGLILVPLVEKLAEHLTAIDEAWDNQINFALFHCISSSIQTALFNAPLVIIVAWGLGKPLDLNFEIFMIVLVVLSILVVGNFLRDGSSNYLEGALLVFVYLIIALTSWYYPNAELTTSNGNTAAEGAARMLRRM